MIDNTILDMLTVVIWLLVASIGLILVVNIYDK